MAGDLSQAEDAALLDAWAVGDGAAARELLRRYTAVLVRFFDRKLHDPIEDLVQETLEACIASRDRLRHVSSFRAYVLGIARHVLYAHLRGRYRGAGELDLEASALAELGPSPSSVLVDKLERRVLLDALRLLPIETQTMLELYYWQRLSGKELADVLGIGERALRSRLRRGLVALREAVEKVAASPDLLESSWADFEAWAQELPIVA
jgi:RNA polymerase sigma factor (sigma-70 family)